MEEIEDLVEYLKPNRDRGEPDELLTLVRVTQFYDPVIIPDEGDVNLKEVDHNEFRSNFRRIKLLIPEASFRKIYVKHAGGETYRYYLKEDDLYRRIEWNVEHDWETLPPEELSGLAEVVITELNSIYWSRSEAQLYIYMLPPVVVTNSFPYDPAHLATLVSGKSYHLDYVNDEGYDSSLWHTILKEFLHGSLATEMSFFERKVELKYHWEKGEVEKYPFLFANDNFSEFVIYYEYYKIDGEVDAEGNYMPNPLYFPGGPFRPEIKNPDKKYAITLEFKSIYGFLAFIKMVYFDNDNTNAVEISGSSRKSAFYQQYLEIINKAKRFEEKSLNGLYKLYYYIPIPLLAKLDMDYLWDFLKRAVKRRVTNVGLDKEDIMVTVLRAIADNTSERDFLEKLRRTMVDEEPLLQWFVYRLDGDNFKKFVYIVWDKWKATNFYSMDEKKNVAMDLSGKSPILLPYTSDKTMCFHHDNASIYWDENYRKIKIDARLDTTYKIEIKEEYSEGFDEIFGEGAAEGFNKFFEDAPEIEGKVEENYVYHPYAPIAIVNEDNPHFIFKDASNPKGQFTYMPAFVMLAREESAFWANFVTAIEYAVDILTTFSGFGNIIKAGRLFKMLKAGKTLMFKSKLATQTATVIKGFAGGVEITSGIGNGLLKLTGTRDSEFGKAISKYLFYLEMLSLTGELTTAIHAGLRKAAAEAVSHSDDVTKATDDALAVIKKNMDGNGVVKQTDEVKQAQETLEALKHLDESSGLKSKGNFSNLAKPKGHVDDLAPKELKSFEAKIKEKDFESAQLFGPEGRILSDIIEGETKLVNISLITIVKARKALKNAGKKMGDISITHNHPPPGGSLSFNDIAFAFKNNVKKIRAVNPDGTVYELIRKVDNYPMAPFAQNKVIENIYDQMKKKFPNITPSSPKYQGTLADVAIEVLGDSVEYVVYK